MIFIDEGFRAYRSDYRYRDHRYSITHDRTSRWALGSISKLDTSKKHLYPN
jgi:hypothetical protein